MKPVQIFKYMLLLKKVVLLKQPLVLSSLLQSREIEPQFYYQRGDRQSDFLTLHLSDTDFQATLVSTAKKSIAVPNAMNISIAL